VKEGGRYTVAGATIEVDSMELVVCGANSRLM
jgi:hypothetical protein